MSVVRSNVAAWFLFLALAGAMGYLRYSKYLQPQHLEMMKMYGPYAVILLHIGITLTAFQDTVFQGILCILIPFYSLYYLFLVSDAFYLRAVGAGLLVGLGGDSAVFFQAHAQDLIAKGNAWIGSGGGNLRTLPK